MKVELSAGTLFWTGLFAILFFGAFFLAPGYSATYSYINLVGTGKLVTANYCRDAGGAAAACSAALTFSDQNVIDGDLNADEWLLADTNLGPIPNNISIDLITPYSIGKVTIYNARTGYTVNGFNLYTSTDNATFVLRTTGNQTNTNYGDNNFTFGPVSARYVRIEQLSAYTNGTGGAAEYYVWESSATNGTTNLTTPINGSVQTNYTTHLNFTGTSQIYGSFICWKNINGTITSLGSTTNGTAAQSNFNQTQGYYSLNVTCLTDNAENTTSATHSYWIKDFVIGETLGPVSAYEKQNSSFNVSVFVAQNVTNITGVFQYNGTNFTAFSTSNATAWTLFSNATAPLVASNNSNVNYRFWFNFSYLNTTNVTEKNLTATQRIDWSAYIQEHSSTDISPLTGEEFSLLSKVAVYYSGNISRAVNFTFNNTVYLGTLYSSNSTHETYRVNLTAPAILTANFTALTNSTLFVTFGSTYARNSTGLNVTTFRPYLGACADPYNNLTLNVSFFYEEDFVSMIGTLEWAGTIEYTGGSYTLNGTATGYSIPFCMYPDGETLNTTMTFNYYNSSGFSTRQYFLDSAPLTSTPTNLSLYLQTADQTANITIRVIENGLDVAALVQFQRYYVPLDSFRVVSMVKTSTDPSGSVAKLRPFDVDYLVVVLVDGVARASYYPVRVTSNAMTFDITSGQIGKFWTTYGDISGTCAFTNSTGTISCTVTDGSGMATSSSLVVKKTMPLSETTVCSITSATAGTTHVCNIGNSTDNTYSYYLTALVGSDTITLASGTLSGTRSNTFGTAGLFMAGLIILAIAMSGAINPASMIIMTFLGVLLAWWSGLAIVTTSALVGIGIVGGLLMYRVRT